MNERFYPALLIAGGGGCHVSTKRLTIAEPMPIPRDLLKKRTKQYDEHIPAAVLAALPWV